MRSSCHNPGMILQTPRSGLASICCMARQACCSGLRPHMRSSACRPLLVHRLTRSVLTLLALGCSLRGSINSIKQGWRALRQSRRLRRPRWWICQTCSRTPSRLRSWICSPKPMRRYISRIYREATRATRQEGAAFSLASSSWRGAAAKARIAALLTRPAAPAHPQRRPTSLASFSPRVVVPRALRVHTRTPHRSAELWRRPTRRHLAGSLRWDRASAAQSASTPTPHRHPAQHQFRYGRVFKSNVWASGEGRCRHCAPQVSHTVVVRSC
mmetsp:Transcript_2548/g.6122  ORF Transcript_2548/g.6122 Transcript_2548/m.6122 type:complete len:270 (+) Transcript_2548:1042-1851(+)